MILRPDGSSQLLITQPDHAGLAAHVMRHWRAEGFPEASRRASILLAIEEHDNGWRDVDAAPILDVATGRILDFVTAPDPVRRAIWPRGVARLSGTPYAAALVAHHAVHVNRRHRSDPPWTAFFTEMEGARDRHLRAAAPLTLDDLLGDYLFLRVGDLISLTFCNGWTEIQKDDARQAYAIRLDGSHLIIRPDPFAGGEVALEVAARELPNRTFGSVAEVQTAFSTARIVAVKGVASGG